MILILNSSLPLWDGGALSTLAVSGVFDWMFTVDSFPVPALTLAGSGVPKVSFTLSPSSSTSSWVALKMKVLSTSPELKVTLAGTPE